MGSKTDAKLYEALMLMKGMDDKETRAGGGGNLPDTMPMLTSTAVHVEEPMNNQVKSVEAV